MEENNYENFEKTLMLLMVIVLLNTTLTTISAKTANDANSTVAVSTMYIGTVKFFNKSKGFGFIIENNSKEEIFVHVTGLIDDIREGDQVTFSTARGRKDMNAIDVKIA